MGVSNLVEFNASKTQFCLIPRESKLPKHFFLIKISEDVGFPSWSSQSRQTSPKIRTFPLRRSLR